MQKSLLISSLVLIIATPAVWAKDGENWEVSMQIAEGGGPLGPVQTQRLCFAKGKDMKEPPPDKDDSCKTSIQQSGKRVNFKSVCKYPDQTITSTGVTEEVSPTHFRSDITMITEEKGRKSQHRQVGNIKKLAGNCDPNEFFRSMQGGQMRQGAQGYSAPKSMPDSPREESASSSPTAQTDKPDTAGSKQEKSEQKSLLETGKGILKGILPF